MEEENGQVGLRLSVASECKSPQVRDTWTRETVQRANVFK